MERARPMKQTRRRWSSPAPSWPAALGICLLAGSCAAQPVVHPKVSKAVSGWAQDAMAPPVFCGTLVKIAYDPRKIADAAPVFFDNATGDLIAACDNPMGSRGQSPSERVTCPPVQWTCGDEP